MVSVVLSQFLNFILAAACVSNLSGGTGDWSTAGTWTSCGGGVPGSGDTVTVTAGDTVTLDSNQTFGTGAAGVDVCELDIEGTLHVPKSPGADIKLTSRGTICVNNGAVFSVADDASTNYLDCDYEFEIEFETATTKYYLKNESGGQTNFYGCVGYGNSSGTVQRARIQSCSPDCDAGAITITLDRTVNWSASASVYRPIVVLGVGGSQTIDPGANTAEEVNAWTSPAANQIALTTTQDHEVGDIVFVGARNIVITVSNVALHSRVYVFSDDALDFSWVRFHEMGYGNSSGTAAVSNDNVYSIGEFDFVSFTNVGFNSTTAVAAIHGRAEMTTLTNTSVWLDNPGTGSVCYNFSTNSTSGKSDLYITDCTCVGGNAKGYCFYSAETTEVETYIDGLWCSDQLGHNGYSSGFTTLENSLFHKTVYSHISHSHHEDTKFMVPVTIDSNEFYWSTGTYCLTIQNPMNLIMKNNKLANCDDSCMYIRGSYGVSRFYSNSYDNCNVSNTLLHGGILLTQSMSNGNVAGEIYMQDEDFGSIAANNRKNIVITEITEWTNYRGGPVKLVCNNCKYGTPTNEYGTYGFQFDQHGTTYSDLILKEGSVFALHNKNQVAGTHETFVGNARLQKESSIVCSSSNIAMKITPLQATFYGNIPIGKIKVDANDVVTVSVQLRKDEAMTTAGTRPRLALSGAGFHLDSDVDEMSDVTDTWETVTVTGTATYDGGVRIYVQTRNKLAGGDDYTPVWLPTLDVYADCLSVTIN